MWIMLNVKLPTRPSPPKMSIFWSLPWPDDVHAAKQKEIFDAKYTRYEWDESKQRYFDVISPSERPEEANFYSHFGKDPNWIGARKIHYAGTDIRVFPHEFSALAAENMRLYVFGESGSTPSHELIPEGVAEENAIKGILDSDTRWIYDAALIDGCTPAQALATALGMDITLPDAEFAPIGWYRILPEYGKYFCSEYEMQEHREIVSEISPEIQQKQTNKKRRSSNLFSLQ